MRVLSHWFASRRDFETVGHSRELPRELLRTLERNAQARVPVGFGTESGPWLIFRGLSIEPGVHAVSVTAPSETSDHTGRRGRYAVRTWVVDHASHQELRGNLAYLATFLLPPAREPPVSGVAELNPEMVSANTQEELRFLRLALLTLGEERFAQLLTHLMARLSGDEATLFLPILPTEPELPERMVRAGLISEAPAGPFDPCQVSLWLLAGLLAAVPQSFLGPLAFHIGASFEPGFAGTIALVWDTRTELPPPADAVSAYTRHLVEAARTGDLAGCALIRDRLHAWVTGPDSRGLTWLLKRPGASCKALVNAALEGPSPEVAGREVAEWLIATPRLQAVRLDLVLQGHRPQLEGGVPHTASAELLKAEASALVAADFEPPDWWWEELLHRLGQQEGRLHAGLLEALPDSVLVGVWRRIAQQSPALVLLPKTSDPYETRQTIARLCRILGPQAVQHGGEPVRRALEALGDALKNLGAIDGDPRFDGFRALRALAGLPGVRNAHLTDRLARELLPTTVSSFGLWQWCLEVTSGVGHSRVHSAQVSHAVLREWERRKELSCIFATHPIQPRFFTAAGELIEALSGMCQDPAAARLLRARAEVLSMAIPSTPFCANKQRLPDLAHWQALWSHGFDSTAVFPLKEMFFEAHRALIRSLSGPRAVVLAAVTAPFCPGLVPIAVLRASGEHLQESARWVREHLRSPQGGPGVAAQALAQLQTIAQSDSTHRFLLWELIQDLAEELERLYGCGQDLQPVLDQAVQELDGRGTQTHRGRAPGRNREQHR